MTLRERLVGLVLIVAGVAVLAGIRLLSQMGSGPIAAPTPPPGIPAWAAISPMACLLPLIALGALGLILIGINRLLSSGP